MGRDKVQTSKLDTFSEYRTLLFSIAYRMLGSAADAEDIVQEAFLRWQAASDEQVRAPRAYLSTVVTRLCIDQVRSAQARREVYVGPWLPEPILTARMPEMMGTAELAESLSFAFLLLLESLGPVERAVFLLREVFDYSYPEIAGIVGKSEANCRQMVKRAREHLRERRPRFEVSREQQEKVTRRFLEVCAGGDMQGLLSMLSGEVTLASDSNGKVQAARNILHGASSVARFLFGVLAKLPAGQAITARMTEINGQPGIAVYIDGEPNSVIALDVEGDRITAVNMVLNPDKLDSVRGAGELPGEEYRLPTGRPRE